MEKYNVASFEKGLKELHIELTKGQMEQFLAYYELLVEWNSFMNLTAITDFEDVILRHFLDSLAIVKACGMDKIQTVLDVGTGAGFPGIPLKIAFPELQVTLLDSLNKRVHFLNTVIEKLSLLGICAIHGRAEDYARREEYREQYDLAVSRAVANLSSLSEYCLPYVKVQGSFISYKSGKIQEELAAAGKAVQLLGGVVRDTIYFQLPGTDLERSFVCIQKVKSTPKKYPRKAGMPTKEPIG